MIRRFNSVVGADRSKSGHPRNQIPLSAFWCGTTAGVRIMWLTIWVITVASAVGLAVIAMTALPKDQRATFGG